jgi:hypothetical protein
MKGSGIMTTWKDFATKSANWLTDSLIVSPLTSLYRKQNEAYKEQLAKQNAQVQAAPKTPEPKPGPAPQGSNDDLTRIAQIYSNTYRRGSLARPKVYHDGKPVAR